MQRAYSAPVFCNYKFKYNFKKEHQMRKFFAVFFTVFFVFALTACGEDEGLAQNSEEQNNEPPSLNYDFDGNIAALRAAITEWSVQDLGNITVTGIVHAVENAGRFWIQDRSAGVFIRRSSTAGAERPAIGDKVSLIATAGQIFSNQTQVVEYTGYTVLSQGNEVYYQTGIPTMNKQGQAWRVNNFNIDRPWVNNSNLSLEAGETVRNSTGNAIFPGVYTLTGPVGQHTDTLQIMVYAGGHTLTGDGNTSRLTENTLAEGSIETNGEQWFRFIATAATQWVHIRFVDSATLDSLSAEVYASNGGNQVGERMFVLRWDEQDWNPSFSRALTIGQEYMIRILPSNGVAGAYRIMFNASPVYLPPVGATITLENTWVDGSVVRDGEQWFRFIATAATQWVHIRPISGSLTSLSVAAVYATSNGGSQVGEKVSLSSSSSTVSFSRALTIGQEYMIQLRGSWGLANYSIVLNAFSTPPEVLPSNLGTMAEDTWFGTFDIRQVPLWLCFTATAETQYLHFSIDRTYFTPVMDVRLHNSNGDIIRETHVFGSSAELLSVTQSLPSLAIGQVYFIRVARSSMININAAGPFFRIMLSKSDTPP
jgi:hypothetical protein